jgi:hypothetical protein
MGQRTEGFVRRPMMSLPPDPDAAADAIVPETLTRNLRHVQ